MASLLVRSVRATLLQQRGKGRRAWGGGEFIPILAFGEEPPPVLPQSGANGWTNKSRRTGLLFKKLEMLTIFDQWGAARAVTALQVRAAAAAAAGRRPLSLSAAQRARGSAR